MIELRDERLKTWGNKIMDKKDLKIVFFGTPEFAVRSLDRLMEEGYNVAAVVTMPDKIGGRGHKVIESDVKKYAVEKGLPVLQPEKLRAPEFIAALHEINADLFIVIAFRMMPEMVWSMPRLGTFNLHASLLPKYRGAAPINRAIMNGESVTGVTTFFLTHEIDTGDIIDRREVDIPEDWDAGQLHDALMETGAEMTLETVGHILAGNLRTKPQPEGEFVAAPKIFKDTCHIDWNKTTREIYNHIRGLSPYPAAWSTLRCDNGKDLDIKIFSTTIISEGKPTRNEEECGKCRIDKKRMTVTTADGEIEILSVQPSGKRRMETADFLLGYQPKEFIKQR